MRGMSRQACRLALATALVSGVARAAFVRSQDDDDDLVELRGRTEQKGQMVFRQAGRITIPARMIDGWIYGNQSHGRDWLDTSLKQKVTEMGRVCGLSDTQKQKLNLAGEGDIQRFESRVDELKAKCQLGVVQNNDIYQRTRPLHAALEQGLFGSASLFHKTLLTALRPEQAARCEQIDRERRTYRYRARVELCVAQLDAVAGLRDEQRQRLVQLILDKTHPPKAFGQLDRFVVLAQMSRLPEETLKSLFDPGQWREVQRRLANARNMIPALKQNGMIFDDEADPAKEADGDAPDEQFDRRRN